MKGQYKIAPRTVVNSVFIVFLLITAYSCTDPIDEKKYNTPTLFEIVLPQQMPILEIPKDNPITVEGIALGRMLFYDPILSGDSTQSCASCHTQDIGFSDYRKFSIGIDGLEGKRRAMPIVNVGYMKRLFWDGRASGVADQASFPVEDPVEMHNKWDKAVDKVSKTSLYPDLFGAAFGTSDVTKERITKAIEQFEFIMISADSKYDKVEYGNTNIVYTDEEQAGKDLFYQEGGSTDPDKRGADCFHCHDGGLITDNLFHNNGLDIEFDDLGLYNVTGNEYDKGKFKTPSLRNVALRAPYMHDGRFGTLKEVLDHYSEGIKVSETIDPLMEFAHEGGVHLTEEEKSYIIAYLNTMTDTSFINNPDFKSPF